MIDRKFPYWSLTIRYMPALGASACAWEEVHYFSTERKLELWKVKNPYRTKDAVWGMHEIGLACAKDLVRLSKKKVKVIHRCRECGK